MLFEVLDLDYSNITQKHTLAITHYGQMDLLCGVTKLKNLKLDDETLE